MLADETHAFLVKRLKLNGAPKIRVDKFTREDFADLLGELKFNVGAEIGVDTGRYSMVLCQRNPSLKLYCIDPWAVFESYHQTQEPYDLLYAETCERLKPYSCTIIRETSMSAVKHFADRSLQFVYIDGNHHYSYVYEDLQEWSKKVMVGGIISGHDYRHYNGETSKNWNIVGAVNNFVRENNISQLIIFGRNTELWGYRSCPQSFMWVNR